MEKTDLEKSGAYKDWVVDYNKDEDFWRKRLILRDYLRDLKELI